MTNQQSERLIEAIERLADNSETISTHLENISDHLGDISENYSFLTGADHLRRAAQDLHRTLGQVCLENETLKAGRK